MLYPFSLEYPLFSKQKSKNACGRDMSGNVEDTSNGVRPVEVERMRVRAICV